MKKAVAFVTVCVSFLCAGQKEVFYQLELEGLLSGHVVDGNYGLISSETAGFCPFPYLNVALGSEQVLRNNSLSVTSFLSGEYRFLLERTALSAGVVGGWRHLAVGTRSFASAFAGMQAGYYYMHNEPVSLRIRYRFLVHPDSLHVYTNVILIGISLNMFKRFNPL
ncbi:MAG: hypothetical protein ACLFTW_07355 [Chitinispirillaceae bacterium]